MWDKLRALAVESYTQPRPSARTLLSLPLDVPIFVLIAAAAVSGSTVLGGLTGIAAATTLGAGPPPFSPLLLASGEFLMVFVLAGVIHAVGRWFGGIGDWRGSLAIVAWMAVLQALLQVVQLGLVVILPPVSALFALATIVWFLWAMSSFVAELHGFESVGLVLAIGLGVLFVLGIVAAIPLVMLGFTPEQLG